MSLKKVNLYYLACCLSSSVAMERMLEVMSGRYASRRHELFLNKKEREQCSGLRTSDLHQLSNPGFLGGGGEKDSAVLRQLMDFFKVLFPPSTSVQNPDPKLFG